MKTALEQVFSRQVFSRLTARGPAQVGPALLMEGYDLGARVAVGKTEKFDPGGDEWVTTSLMWGFGSHYSVASGVSYHDVLCKLHRKRVPDCERNVVRAAVAAAAVGTAASATAAAVVVRLIPLLLPLGRPDLTRAMVPPPRCRLRLCQTTS